MDPMLILLFLACQATVSWTNLIDSTAFGEYVYSYYDSGNDNTYFCTASLQCSNWVVGGQVAMPKTAEINNEIFQLVRSKRAWIGAIDMQSEGYWMWVDNTPLSYSNWDSHEPNNLANEDCAVLNGETNYGDWYDAKCSDKYGYVCQFSSDMVRAFDYSEFTFHEMQKNFESAEEKCKSVDARVVKIENKKEERLLLKKLNANFLDLVKENRYWIRGTTKDESLCVSIGADGLQKTDCLQENFGVICETARPVVKVSDEHPTVMESEELQINCIASGYPVPELRWYKDDELVSNQVNGKASSTLYITNASAADAGRYACVATNIVNDRKMTSKGVSYVSVVQE